MKILLKTKLLLILSVCLVIAVVIELQSASVSGDSLPGLVEILKDDIKRIEITHQGNKVVLEQLESDWVQVAPFNGTADWARIKSMILNFRKGISMDVLVDPNPKDDGKLYGLDASTAITVEMWKSDGSSPDLSFELGNDAEAGSSFVRLRESNSVYRAHMGGRRRFAYSASDWLNQRLLQFDLNDLTAIEVVRGETRYTLIKDEAWRIQGYDVALDVQKLSTALQSLSVMRIGERVQQEVQDPWMSMNFEVAGQTIAMAIATPEERMALVDLAGSTMTVPLAPLERFSYGPEYFKDTHVLSIGSRDDLDLIRYTTELMDIIIQQDLSNGFWKVLQPTNIDLEMRDVFFMVNTLSSLSSLQEVPYPEKKSMVTIDIRRLTGDIQRLFIYGVQDEGILCAVEGQTHGFIAPADDVERILNGFGQSSLFKK